MINCTINIPQNSSKNKKCGTYLFQTFYFQLALREIVILSSIIVGSITCLIFRPEITTQLIADAVPNQV